MELDKYKISIRANEIIAYAWQFTSIVSTDFHFTDNQKSKLKSDINIGIDKSNRDLFLTKLEFLTRDSVDCYIEIALSDIPNKMPRHLDDSSEYLKHKKLMYKYLEFRRIEEGMSFYHSINDRLIINFSESDIFKFFTKMYVNFEIYATEHDNKVGIKKLNDDKTYSNCELIIWGVYNKEIIYY